jgi:putative hemolysin
MLSLRAASIARSASSIDAGAPLLEQGRYAVRLARSEAEIEAAQRLRFEVFNVELGEGLKRSLLTGRDADEFDASCEHLIVLDRHDGSTVGTYRLQSAEAARAGHGFYTDTEFDLAALPAALLDGALELGRACIARRHRNTRVLYLLWRGIAEVARCTGKRWLFGCCSLTSQDPREGRVLYDLLATRGALHPQLRVRPRSDFRCFAALDGEPTPAVAVPRLFDMYLAMGARVCSPPAIDRAFGTIDFLVLFDLHDLDPRSQRRFLPPGAAA